MIKVIINADDFGMSRVFNEKILDLLSKGYTKSTTVMVDRIILKQSNQVAALKRLYNSGSIGVGLHIEVDEAQSVEPKITRQISKFREIFGRDPDHFDMHKIETFKNAAPKVYENINKLRKPARNYLITPKTKTTTTTFFLTKNSVDEAIKFLETLKDGETCEFITHPGESDPNTKTSLQEERLEDYNKIIELQKIFESDKFQNIKFSDL